MVSAVKLMGSGFSALQAQQLSDTPTTLAGVGTAQTGAAAITANTFLVNMTTASGQTAFVMPNTDVGDGPYMVYNSTATTALLYPDSGSQINLGGTNTSVNIAQNKTALLMRITTTNWCMILSA